MKHCLVPLDPGQGKREVLTRRVGETQGRGVCMEGEGSWHYCLKDPIILPLRKEFMVKE